MPKTQKAIKKIEKRVASNFTKGFGSFFKSIGMGFVRIFKVLDSKLTIMIVPHSQSKVINIQTNIFAMILTFVISVGVLASFFYFNNRSIAKNSEISALIEQNRETLASLDELRDENANLFQAAKRFQTSLSQSLSLLGIEQLKTKNEVSSSNSDLSSLFSSSEMASGTTREVADVRELTTYLEDAVKPI